MNDIMDKTRGTWTKTNHVAGNSLTAATDI